MLASPAQPVTAARAGCLRRFGGRAQPLVRLVCFPWCGAGASVYRRLAPTLPDHVDLLAVQLPGREERFAERRLRRMEQIVEHVVGDVLSVLDRPLVLFGHSMGALVAYEVALAMRARAGREPDALIVSGHGSPRGAARRERVWHTAEVDAFVANLRDLGGTPPELLADAEVMRMLLPLLRADYEALETYLPRAERPLSCPLVACAGDEDREVTPATMRDWEGFTTGPFRLHWFAGDHFHLAARPAELTRCLEAWVAPRARAATGAVA
jgi:surfactin synthase thioesterase subunit